MPRKILIIGAGGIGSYLIDTLNNLTGNGSYDAELYEITVSDPDTVEEKNVTYQRFTTDNVGKNKAFVMKMNYEQVKI
jgi:tRNA A37 threonylcarbamoyladenosine dehydratase